MECQSCSKPLTGRQVRFCSENCSKLSWKRRNPDKQRAYVRKVLNKQLQERKDYINKLKSKPCADCGVSYPPYVMDFDHVRGTKKMSVSRITLWGWKELLEEVAKCELVCANCHRLRTLSRF